VFAGVTRRAQEFSLTYDRLKLVVAYQVGKDFTTETSHEREMLPSISAGKIALITIAAAALLLFGCTEPKFTTGEINSLAGV
jgi:hypothetical protein